MIDFMKDGETYENQPKELMRAVKKYGREACIEALYAIDVKAMVKEWDTQTLKDVVEFGTDLAFNRELANRINYACKQEELKRNPRVVRATNGMTE